MNGLSLNFYLTYYHKINIKMQCDAFDPTIQRYVWLYNHHIPQKALGYVPPIEAMKRWYAEKPELFIKIPRNRPGPDS